MSKLLILTAAVLACAAPATVLACDREAMAANQVEKTAQCNHSAMVEATRFEKLTVAQVLHLRSAGKAQVFDANGAETRSTMGVVPGAVLLTSAGNYDVTKELPKVKDTQLIFYCYNEMCGASHMAARRAAAAGYTRVAVMPEGIQGWRAKGQATALPQS